MRKKITQQIKLQKLFQTTHSHANDKQQTKLHYQAAVIIARYGKGV